MNYTTLHIYTSECYMNTVAIYEVEVLGVYHNQQPAEVVLECHAFLSESDIIYNTMSLPFEVAVLVENYLQSKTVFNYRVDHLCKRDIDAYQYTLELKQKWGPWLRW